MLKKMSDTVLNVSEFINKLNNYISDVKLVMVDMIKERNIYKAWVSIQKLTKHTMNLRFMYFKEITE